MFARDEEQLEDRKRLLERDRLKILSVKLLDTPPMTVKRDDALKDGVELFNEERFWESHEILEQIWRISKGIERDAIQGIILTAAAFVHYQKGEDEISLSVLKRARAKLSKNITLGYLDLDKLRGNVDAILDSGQIQLLKL
jgi:predicted metal-dependent hydrolase